MKVRTQYLINSFAKFTGCCGYIEEELSGPLFFIPDPLFGDLPYFITGDSPVKKSLSNSLIKRQTF